MKKSRFTECQILIVLNNQEKGISVNDIYRQHGISDATFYNWKAKYGGLKLQAKTGKSDLHTQFSHIF